MHLIVSFRFEVLALSLVHGMLPEAMGPFRLKCLVTGVYRELRLVFSPYARVKLEEGTHIRAEQDSLDLEKLIKVVDYSLIWSNVLRIGNIA